MTVGPTADGGFAWTGDRTAFLAAAVAIHDLRQFSAALESVPASERPAVRDALRAALNAADTGEPSIRSMSVGAPLVQRMQTPAGLLRQQIRFQKRDLVDGWVGTT